VLASNKGGVENQAMTSFKRPYLKNDRSSWVFSSRDRSPIQYWSKTQAGECQITCTGWPKKV